MPHSRPKTIEPEMCVAMRCPLYTQEHDISTEGCLYDEDGQER